MREILFRGQQVDNGEWVTGNLVKINNWSMHRDYEKSSSYINTDCEEVDILTFLKGSKLFAQTMLVQVKDKTVCQFTGLLDKNGKKIFEGDLVNIFDWGGMRGNLLGVSVIEWDIDHGCWQLENPIIEDQYDFWNKATFEVIGTIHDK